MVPCRLPSLPSMLAPSESRPLSGPFPRSRSLSRPSGTLSPHQVTPDCRPAYQTDSHDPFPASSHSQLWSCPPNRLSRPFSYIKTTPDCRPTHQTDSHSRLSSRPLISIPVPSPLASVPTTTPHPLLPPLMLPSRFSHAPLPCFPNKRQGP